MNRKTLRNFVKRILIKLGLRNQIQKSVRRDIEIIPIQANLDLLVYWKVLTIGKGPAVSLKAFESEILKFDCFGVKKGHYHVAPDYSTRISFEEETTTEQIQRTCSELMENAQKYLSVQPDDRINNLKIEKDLLFQAVKKAEEKMKYFIQTIPELKDLR